MKCDLIYCENAATWTAYLKNVGKPPLRLCHDHYRAVIDVTDAQRTPRQYGEPYDERETP